MWAKVKEKSLLKKLNKPLHCIFNADWFYFFKLNTTICRYMKWLGHIMDCDRIEHSTANLHVAWILTVFVFIVNEWNHLFAENLYCPPL